ncbi:MAG: KEOPS complex subunit Pcc1 [Candidatus Thorarchaeota archaeon]|jgi:tRNA threonylcarbamoyladenosine modification (KEOPS) complex  Pcc1 subunit
MESSEIAEALRSALEPETDSGPSDRARATVSVQDETLVIDITAEDLTSLRAAMNSYVAWVSACVASIDSVTGQNP